MTAFARIGGQPVVEAIARDFYALLDREPRFAEVRSFHPDDIGMVASAFALWLAAWLGGPPLRPNPAVHGCLMSRHRAMDFGLEPARQWLAAMEVVLVRHVHEEELRDMLYGAFLRMAAAMVDAPQRGVEEGA